MSTKKLLTNELLTSRFENPFALVNYAISLARTEMLRGDDLESNPVNEVIETITSNYDLLKDDEEEIEEESL